MAIHYKHKAWSIYISLILLTSFIGMSNAYSCDGTEAYCSGQKSSCYNTASQAKGFCDLAAHGTWDPKPCKAFFCSIYVDTDTSSSAYGEILPSCSAPIVTCDSATPPNCTSTTNPCLANAQACINSNLPFCAGMLTGALNACQGSYATDIGICDANYAACKIPCVTIQATAGSGGSISPFGTVKVQPGQNRVFTITPNACYHITNVIVDGQSVGAVSSYTFNNVQGDQSSSTTDHTITAYFAINTYTITSSAGSGGTITPQSATVTCGNSQTFTIIPDACYHIADVRVDGVSIGAVSSYTFSNVTSNRSISATFSNTYNLNVTKSAGNTGTGTVASSPAGIACGPNSTSCGASFRQDCPTLRSFVTLAATPVSVPVDSASSFAGWSGACSGTGDCTLTMNGDKQVAATFNILPPIAAFTATPTAGFAPSMEVNFTNQSIRAWIDGQNNILHTYIWDFGDDRNDSSEIYKKHPSHIYKTVGAFTAKLLVTNPSGTSLYQQIITVDPCPNLPVRVLHPDNSLKGSYLTLQGAYNSATDGDSIRTLEGYLIGDLIADNPKAISLTGGYGCDYQSQVGSTSLQGSITVNSGTLTVGDIALVSSSSDGIYNIVATSDPGGSIAPVGTVPVAQGGDFTFTITPDINYLIADVLVDGVSVGAVNTYQFTAIATNHTIEAKFAKSEYTITVKAGAGGTISPAGHVDRVIGKWNGFTPGIGVYQDGIWYVDQNGNNVWDGPTVDRQYSFGVGQTGAIPIAGDWTGDGTSKLGVFNGGTWYIDFNSNGVWDGPAMDRQYSFGNLGDFPVAGDWNGDGRSEIGVFRSGTWYLDTNGSGAWDAGDVSSPFGIAGDVPIAGDWNGSGATKIGVLRGKTWYLDMNGNGTWGAGDVSYSFGVPGDVPITGDWNGDGRTKIGVLRGNAWWLDLNGNGVWEGTPIDLMYDFGDWIANRVMVPYGSSQLFTITPNAGFHLVDVLANGISAGPVPTYPFGNVKADQKIEAVFSNAYALTVARAGEGTGAVTSNPAGISCGSTCSQSFVQGSAITLTATADIGSTFVGWSGGGCTGTGTCSVALTADMTVTALFDPAVPVADFSGTPTTGVQTVTVVFSDLSTENPTSWSWDFGDGTTSTQKNPTHTYNVVGMYNVTLTAINARGSNTVSKTAYVTVQPYAKILGSETVYRTVQEAYDAAASGAIIQVRNLNLIENLTLTSSPSKTVTINGGCSADYSLCNGTTSLKGKITTTTGSTTIKNFILQQ